MGRTQQKLTKRVVDALKIDHEGRDVIHFDSEIPRFGVRVKPSGVKTYILQYRNKFGQLRRITLGRVGELTPEQARTRAIEQKVGIANGADPSASRRAERNALTVDELCDEYLETGEANNIKASTLSVDKSRIERHVKPLLGTRAVASLTPADMEKFLRDVRTGKSVPKPTVGAGGKEKRPRGGKATGGPGVASRTLGMLGTILQRAVRDGVLTSNPVRGIKRPRDQARKPPFSFDTVDTLGSAIRELEAEDENAVGLRAIKFLLLTGTRRMEALTLTWGAVDTKARCLRLGDTKSGPQTRPIGRSALELLASFKPGDAKPEHYVFPGAVEGRHLVGLPRVWARVATRAKITGVSLHGLRHWFASAAAEMNFSELTIAGLLGHHVKGVTARYATAPDSALLNAADRVSLRLHSVLNEAEPKAKVQSLFAQLK